MANARCPGCGMMVADPLGHLAHGMAQATPEPTFAGKSLNEVVREAMEAEIVEDQMRANGAVWDGVEHGVPARKADGTRATSPAKSKGGRPRKA